MMNDRILEIRVYLSTDAPDKSLLETGKAVAKILEVILGNDIHTASMVNVSELEDPEEEVQDEPTF